MDTFDDECSEPFERPAPRVFLAERTRLDVDGVLQAIEIDWSHPSVVPNKQRNIGSRNHHRRCLDALSLVKSLRGPRI